MCFCVSPKSSEMSGQSPSQHEDVRAGGSQTKCSGSRYFTSHWSQGPRLQAHREKLYTESLKRFLKYIEFICFT